MFTQLQLCNIYFWLGHHNDQTLRSTINLLVQLHPVCSDFQFCIFSVIVTTARQWRLSKISAKNIEFGSKITINDQLNRANILCRDLCPYSMCAYIFGRVVFITPFCIFSIVIASALHRSILVYYVYFWWGDHHRRLLSPVQHQWQALSVLFISCRHHDQSNNVDWVYFGKVIIITGRPHDLLTNFDLYIFGKVIIITCRHHNLLTNGDLCIFLVRCSSSPVITTTC